MAVAAGRATAVLLTVLPKQCNVAIKNSKEHSLGNSIMINDNSLKGVYRIFQYYLCQSFEILP